MAMRRCGLLIVGLLLFAAIAVAQQKDDDQQAQTALKGGEKVSTALATVTSTAISPLVGVCAIGAWQYYHTPKAQRDQLPLIQKPKFWIPILILLVLIFIKDTFGGFAPLIKKPLDAAEVLFVNHAALVLVAFPFVLEQVSRVMGFTSWKGLFAYVLSGPVVYAATPETSGVHHAFSVATAVLYTVVGIVVTFVVWLVGHSFDVLAMISPFPFLDFLLKAVRNTIFAILAVTALLSPKIGLLLSLGVIVFSFLIFGWAWRMAFFGTVFAWGLLRVLADGGASETQSRRPSAGLHGARRQAATSHLRTPVALRRWHATVPLSPVLGWAAEHDQGRPGRKFCRGPSHIFPDRD